MVVPAELLIPARLVPVEVAALMGILLVMLLRLAAILRGLHLPVVAPRDP
jgi:uncharacterized membrane protein YeiH